MSYSNLIAEHVRLAVLQVLEQDAQYAHNETVLQAALSAVGHGVSADRLRSELAWLAEQGLLAVSDVGGLQVAKLTARGGDVVLGHAQIPGVARPRPGADVALRPSSIDGLPEKAREALHAWLRDPGITQKEAAERTNALLEELGLPQRVTHQSVNRYDLRMRKVGEKLRQSRQVSDQWIAKLGSAPGGKLGHLVTEMLRTLAFDLTLQLQDLKLDAETLPGVVGAAGRISLMAQRLERSSEISERRERQLKREAAEEMAAQVTKEAKAGRKVSPERVREIVRENLWRRLSLTSSRQCSIPTSSAGWLTRADSRWACCRARAGNP